MAKHFYSREMINVGSKSIIKSFEPVVEGYIVVKFPTFFNGYLGIDPRSFETGFYENDYRVDEIFLDKEAAIKYSYYLNYIWPWHDKSIWVVKKVYMDKELIEGIYDLLIYFGIAGRRWPRLARCPVIFIDMEETVDQSFWSFPSKKYHRSDFCPSPRLNEAQKKPCKVIRFELMLD